MNTDATSLTRLHDILMPPAVSWWPLATSWYVLFVLLMLATGFLCYRYYRRWKANAYRRAALRELTNPNDAPAIAELLRRTALAAASRSEIASKAGSEWADWLASQSAHTMPMEVHQLLSTGIYGGPGKEQNVRLLRQYAVLWISDHTISDSSL